MSYALAKLASLRQDIEGIGSLPLLPSEDLVEYSGLCEQVLAVTEELGSRSGGDGDAVSIAECVYDIGVSMRRAGDGLTSAEVFSRAGRYAEARTLAHNAARAYNAAG